MITQDQIDSCIGVARQYGAHRVVLFGSALTDCANARDIDLIVRGVNGWKLIEMGAMMEHAAHVTVDVIPEDDGGAFVTHNVQRGRVIYEGV